MKSNSPQLQVWQLLRDTLTYTTPIYVPVLSFFLPRLLISLLMLGMSLGASILVSIIDTLAITPFVTGAAIFYIHQNLTNRGATIPEALQSAGERFSQLVFLTFILLIILMVGFTLLIIPGIYLSVRLSFAYYALMIERRSAFDSLNRSWQLTQGHWWKIFRAFLALMLVSIPIFIGIIIFVIVDPDGTEVGASIITFLVSPFLSVFYVFLFMRFVNLVSDHIEQTNGI